MNSILVMAAGLLFAGAAPFQSDPPKECPNCATWNEPQAPFRVFGNTYYVGTRALASILVTTKDGLILIDGALPQSAGQIFSNIETLGFDPGDIRFILNSHAHFDHAGGIAALQRASGAVVAVSPESAKAFEKGGVMPDDPQYGFGEAANAFPPVPDLRVLSDGETISLNGTVLTAHFTPGHTPGGTSWTWKACEQEKCLDVVYADSLTAVSAPGFRFTGDAAHDDVSDTLRHSIDEIANLPCDIMLSTHTSTFHLQERLDNMGDGPNPFIDAGACRALAAKSLEGLEKRIEREEGQPERQGK